ncbi:tyrosine-type recombinase/integrase [Pelagibacterium nitratireducens]|uniref:Tyrosine-type recombinase/integrase n=1 Tax=Pelagibacterium nitratireducens TaxID=1046114 RepID=A0ABZ2HYG1_9HYPH
MKNATRRKSPIPAIRAIVQAAEPGMWAQGAGLYLVVAKSGNASWAYRYSTKQGKRRTMTLAPFDEIDTTTMKALELQVAELAKQVANGCDPLVERHAANENSPPIAVAKVETFEEAARAFIAENRGDWKNEKHAAQWSSTLERYVYPVIGSKLPFDVTTADVVNVLRQEYKDATLWDGARETASRVRMRMEAVLGRAYALGKDDPRYAEQWATFRNPAQWKGHLDRIFKANRRTKRHFKAMDWKDLPAYFTQLISKSDFSSHALRLTILCATRTSETLNAKWSEIDFAERVWHIPAERMKAGQPHSVPLSNTAIELLSKLPRMEENPYIFPGSKKNRPLSNMAMLEILRGMNDQNFTVHGFRSAFRDWVSETTMHPDTIAEMALAHTIKNKTEAAYRRGTAFDRRRNLMQQWDDYLNMEVSEYKGKWRAFIAHELIV